MLPRMNGRPGYSPAVRLLSTAVVLCGAAAVAGVIVGSMSSMTTLQTSSLGSLDRHVVLRIPDRPQESVVYEKERDSTFHYICRLPVWFEPPGPITNRLPRVSNAGHMPRPETDLALAIPTRIRWSDGRDWPTAYPYYRVAPSWPAVARMGNGGCVEYGFTVTGQGTTRDIVVIRSSNNAFERYGKRALEQFRYPPDLKKGKAGESPGQSIRMIWQIEGEPLPDHPACRD